MENPKGEVKSGLSPDQTNSFPSPDFPSWFSTSFPQHGCAPAQAPPRVGEMFGWPKALGSCSSIHGPKGAEQFPRTKHPNARRGSPFKRRPLPHRTPIFTKDIKDTRGRQEILDPLLLSSKRVSVFTSKNGLGVLWVFSLSELS